MTTFTPKAAIPILELTDAANAQTYANSLATALEPMVTPVYATTGSRDLVNPSPSEGDKCYVNSKGLFMFNGTDWRYTSAWANWTPTWSTSTGLNVPTIGNGSFTCRYTVINGMCYYRFTADFGTTTNFNSSGTTTDNWTFTLPVNSATPSSVQPIGMGKCLTGATGKGSVPVIVMIPGLGTHVMSFDIAGASTDFGVTDNSGYLDRLSPFTWNAAGTTPLIRATGQYEVAVI